jgi:hypothetical protein
MEITIITKKTVTETKVIDIELPFYFHTEVVYSTDSDSLYDMEEKKWGIVYSVKDDYGEDVLRVTEFEESCRDLYDNEEWDKKYKIQSFEIKYQSDRAFLEYCVKAKCTQDEFNRESSRIFKSITNQ